MFRVAHFFAGAGGGILAGEILGHQSVLAVEIDERRCASLRQRVSEGWAPGLHVECCDIREFNAERWAGQVDVVSAGFPCQDISSAGKGAGIRGERSGLYFSMLKAIDVIRPPIIFLENSPTIRTRGRDIVLQELVARGYAWHDGSLAASHAAAPHIRNRWWCLAANADGIQMLDKESSDFDVKSWGLLRRRKPDAFGRAEKTPDTLRQRCGQARSRCAIRERESEASKGIGTVTYDLFDGLEIALQQSGISETERETIKAAARYTGAYNWLPINGDVCGVVYELADRVDRVKMCGDGQVPIQAAVAWMILAGWV